MAKVHGRLFEQVVARDGAGKGREIVERPELERAEGADVGVAVPHEEQHLPQVEAVRDASDKAQRRQFQKACEGGLRMEDGAQNQHGHERGDGEDVKEVLRSPGDERENGSQCERPEVADASEPRADRVALDEDGDARRDEEGVEAHVGVKLNDIPARWWICQASEAATRKMSRAMTLRRCFCRVQMRMAGSRR